MTKRITILNSSRTELTLDQTLTNYAYGLVPEAKSAIANFLAPETPVGQSTGRYMEFSDKNAFVLYDTERPLGGAATRIKVSAGKASFNCTPQALEVPIDDAEVAADGDEMALKQARVRALVSVGAVAHEHKVITACTDGLAAVAGKGNWSNPNTDPMDELDEQIEALSNVMGMMPNRMLIGLGAYRILRNNPKVRALVKGQEGTRVSLEKIASELLNPAMEMRVGVLARDTTKLGQTKSSTNIVGARVILFYASQMPTQYDPSFMKTFMVRGGSVTAVWTYREPRAEIHSLDWSEDVKVTGSACARRIDVA